MPSRADRCIETIRTQCRILAQEKVPYIFSTKPARNVVSFGTKFSLEKFEEQKPTFETAFNDDIKKMCDPEDDDEDMHETHEVGEFEQMKTPLSLANHDEIKKYGRYLILKDHMERFPASLERNIKYGHEEWEASFWPNDMLKWSDITKNFSNIRINEFPGKASILDVLREAIKRGLASKGVNPEKHYDPSLFGKVEENKRKRNRGIHVPQERVEERLVDYDDSDNQSDSSGSSTFLPRRPNLRNLRDTSTSSSESDPYDRSNAEAQEEMISQETSSTPAPETSHVVDVREEAESPTQIPERPHLITRLLSPNRLRLFPLPAYLQNVATGKKIRHNPTVGGLSLWSAVGQFIGADAKELRLFANAHLYKYFQFFRELFSFPLDVHVHTATERERKRIKSMYDYYAFLKSDDSMNADHTGKAEVILLASILNQPITIVHFQEQGFPSGTPLEDRCYLTVHEPLAYPHEESNYHQSEGPWILKEDLHFSLLVPTAVNADDPLEVDTFIANLRSSLFPGEIDDNHNGEEQEQYQSHEDPAEDSPHSNMSEYFPNYEQQNCPFSQNASSSSSSPNYTSPSCQSSSSSFNVTGRPKRLRKRKVIFDNSEPTKAKRKKTVLTDSIERLMKPPTENQKRKEKEEQEKHERIRLDQEAHRIEMEELEERAQQLRKKRERETEISKELQIQSKHLRENLSERDIRIMFKNNLKYFKKIEIGLEHSWRHKMYHSKEGNRNLREKYLFSKMISCPFSDEQQEIIEDEVKKVWLKNKKMQMENGRYVDLVLLPEIFVVIYQIFVRLPTREEAEKRIMNVLGSIDPEDISPESSLLLK